MSEEKNKEKTKNVNKRDITWKEYLQKYEKFLREVRKETFKKFPEELNSLMVPISDSIEFYSRGKKEWVQTPHSLIFILKNYFWKISNWISYEILNGKYFEAMRDTRFLFEGSIQGMILEDVIERKVFPSEMSLKLDIINIWKKAKNEAKIYREKNYSKRKSKARDVIIRYFEKLAKQNKLKEMFKFEKEKYIKKYSSILADKRLGFSLYKLIDEEIGRKNFLEPLTPGEKEKFKEIWASLSEYTHFPGNFFHRLVEEGKKGPTLIFVEIFNENLFKECLTNYLITLDLFYSVALWRWADKKTKRRMKHIDVFWRRNLKEEYKKYFTLFPKMLQFYGTT